MGEWFNEAKDSKRLSALPLFATGSQHRGPRDPLKRGVWKSTPDLAYETCAQQIAGRFTSNQANLHGLPN